MGRSCDPGMWRADGGRQIPIDPERFPQIICEIYRRTAELEAMFPGRSFTPDGHMVGSIGEVLAAYHYDLRLLPPGAPGHDAEKDGRLIQIKAKRFCRPQVEPPLRQAAS